MRKAIALSLLLYALLLFAINPHAEKCVETEGFECEYFNHDWCSNAGCDWGFIGCEGTAWPCWNFLNQTECGGQDGCEWSHCTNKYYSCEQVLFKQACRDVENCEWDNSGQECIGKLIDCSDFTTQFSCEGHSFTCKWDGPDQYEKCGGTAVPCAEIETAGACLSQKTGQDSKCDIVYGCRGIPKACAYFESDACEAHPYCEWQGTTATPTPTRRQRRQQHPRLLPTKT